MPSNQPQPQPQADPRDMSAEARALDYAVGIRRKDLRTPIVPDKTFFPFLFSHQ